MCKYIRYIACWYNTWFQRFCVKHKNNLVWYLNQQDSLVLMISNDRGSLNQTQIILEISRRAHDLRNHNFTHFGISLIIGEQSPGSSQKSRMCDKAWSTTACFNGEISRPHGRTNVNLFWVLWGKVRAKYRSFDASLQLLAPIYICLFYQPVVVLELNDARKWIKCFKKTCKQKRILHQQ